jgi:hypothetical protein
VDEREWLASTDPSAMLLHLCGEEGSPEWEVRMMTGARPSDRKLRLFACACCRLCHDVRRDFADRYEAEGVPDLSDAGWARWWCGDHIIGVPKVTRAALLREVVGNPWRPARLPPCRRCDGDGEAHGSERPFAWEGPGSYPGPCPVCHGARHALATPAVLGIARRAHDLRDWEALPILADALEDAGCEDRGVLDHLRDLVLCPGCSRGEDTEWYGGGGGWCAYCDRPGPDLHRIPAAMLLPQHARLHGPHVRGCWALDLMLGKE